jgi:hypothetical protein
MTSLTKKLLFILTAVEQGLPGSSAKDEFAAIKKCDTLIGSTLKFSDGDTICTWGPML